MASRPSFVAAFLTAGASRAPEPRGSAQLVRLEPRRRHLLAEAVEGPRPAIGMPRSSRYQLRQPVTQTVVLRRLDARGLEARRSPPRSALTSRQRPARSSSMSCSDVADLQLGDLDQREVADRTVRAVQHEEVREAGDRDRQVGDRPLRPHRRRADRPSRPTTSIGRRKRSTRKPVASTSTSSSCSRPSRVRTPSGSTRSMPSVTSSAFGCWIAW